MKNPWKTNAAKRKACTEERILQITNNDIAEQMNYDRHTKAELRACVTYWANATTEQMNQRIMELTQISLKALELAKGAR
jgi:hypothetical protein